MIRHICRHRQEGGQEPYETEENGETQIWITEAAPYEKTQQEKSERQEKQEVLGRYAPEEELTREEMLKLMYQDVFAGMTNEIAEKEGDIAGKTVYYLNGKEIGSVNLLYAESVEKARFWDYLKKAFQSCLVSFIL